ncbi:methylmalonyl Co-A mutase-associated GTPase MeaB [Ancylobacter sp. Lp-2]|uniref:methylmalonyl Co-A mutase-associated GTPase MeaB n=1 Tax=Ancylobacter sp. Lp-2 TaxID=2881339 RepID=UPI001E6064D9|nr:methylmalonyl Co-A mutase-associated GTPase MeaB [Ancylobacter sp. Lp-2]MCB4768971.1 methylmalonyl Co-A mutase-associated GTPase MeaB [Ancylobacter sp. Lp-2]
MIHAPALPSLDQLVDGVRAGRRAVLARAITLVESRKPAHRALAEQLLQALLPFTGAALRVGITGVPGVGKSTTIDSLGTMLTGKGHRVAVLAVDPSSTRTGGSILGDKTRMARLAVDAHAFVRPSPSAGTLGGVAARTRETLLLCEAAGYDVVLVETVGVGQSETAVADMTDTFLVLMLPGAGDELQGLKKGILELADIVAVNKADGDGLIRARAAAAEYRAALQVLGVREPHWSTPVLACSGLTGEGLETLWQQVQLHGERSQQAGAFAARRSAQQVRWMWTLLDERIRERIRTDTTLRDEVPTIAAEVAAGRLAPGLGAARIAARLGLEPT